MARDVRRPQRDAADLDARSDRIGRSDRRADVGGRRAGPRRRGAGPEREPAGVPAPPDRHRQPLADPARILHETCRSARHTPPRQSRHLRRSRGRRLRHRRRLRGRCALDGGPRSVAQSGRQPHRRHPERLDACRSTTRRPSPHTPEERAALEAACISAYICPLLIKNGRFVGAFGIHSRSPRVWTPDEIALVQEVADRIWTTLEHRKAEAELRANEERLAFLLRLNDALRPLSDAGGHPGNCGTGISASTSAQPASATRNSRAASTSFAASTPAASSRSSDTPLRITVSGRRCARRSGAARPSSSTTSRRIRGSATTTGRRSGRGKSRRSSA